MATQQYITFRWCNLYYGIQATLVKEIFPLPELIIIPEPPTEMIGLLNLRGEFLPILHLNGLPEQRFPGCNVSDSVIVLQREELPIGLVVHDVSDVLELDTEKIVNQAFDEFIVDVNPELVVGIAKLDIGNIILINPQKIIDQPDAILTRIEDIQRQSKVATSQEQETSSWGDERSTSKTPLNFYELYCPYATPEEREIFQQRADNLKQAIEHSTVTKVLMSLAVVELGDQYFGLDLDWVREFTDISNLTPIPCCPNHIVGNMNLRGEIVTFVDIRNALNIPIHPIAIGTQSIVIQVDDIVAGLPVDRILEMTSLSATELTPLSEILPDSEQQYLRGTAVFQEKILRILDLPKLFTQGGLIVNEQA